MLKGFRFIKNVWIGLLGLFLLGFLFFWGVSKGIFGEMPEVEDLENPKNALSSEIYGEDGVVIGQFFLENRINAKYEDISPNVYNALIATEDIRFFSHSGIDFRGTLRAIVSLGTDGGASTITQQLSKNMFSRFDKPSSKLGRVMQKFKEWVISVELEKRYTKKEILVMYLNTVPFSGLSFGITAASKEFFNKSPKKLKLEEAAVLVGMLKANWRYNPKYNAENSLNRRNTVLRQMNKYDLLSDDSMNLLKELPIKLNYRSAESEGLAPYFKTYLGEYLKKWCKDHNYNLYRSGLKIYTTINSEMQMAAEEAMKKHMTDFQKKFTSSWGKEQPWRYITDRRVIPNFIEDALKRTDRYKLLAEQFGDDHNKIISELKKPVKMTIFTWNGDRDTTMSPYDSMVYIKKVLHAGFIAIEPETGYIKAWVGGINHKFFKYDHVNVNARRQVGSTFKPIVYATAIDINKFTPCTEFPRERTVFISGGQEWSPKNFDGKSGGIWPMWKGLALSDNLITAQIMKSLGDDGPDLVVQFAERIGIQKDRIPRVPSICLGTVELSPFEMASAYSAFVNKGLWVEPSFITRIEDKDGNVIEEFQNPKHDQVLSAEKAYIMTHLLERVVQRGTAYGMTGRFGIEGSVGGKTGTTQGAADGWFVGITKGLVCATWVGADDPSVRVRSSLIGQGSQMAMPIFGYFMSSIQKNPKLKYKAEPFTGPDNFNPDWFNCDKAKNNRGDLGGSLDISGLGD
jgi:penicillin-binding protein 1A